MITPLHANGFQGVSIQLQRWGWGRPRSWGQCFFSVLWQGVCGCAGSSFAGCRWRSFGSRSSRWVQSWGPQRASDWHRPAWAGLHLHCRGRPHLSGQAGARHDAWASAGAAHSLLVFNVTGIIGAFFCEQLYQNTVGGASGWPAFWWVLSGLAALPLV